MTRKAATEKTHPGGRRPITLSDLTENWRDLIHDIYRSGGSDAEVKVALAIFPARAMRSTRATCYS